MRFPVPGALALCVLLFLSACQKELSSEDGNPPPPTSNSSKIKTYNEDISYGGQHSVETFNLSYDAQDRLVSMISVTNPGNKFLYSYGPGNVYHLDLYNDNVLSIHEDFFLNSDLMTDSTFQYNDTRDSSTEKFVCNSAKQIVAIKNYDYSKVTGGVLRSTTTLEHDSKGNVIKETSSNAGVTTYTYYTDLQNNIAGTNPNDLKNPNLTKTTTGDFGGIPVSLNHVYTFDPKNRVSSETATDNTMGITLVKMYTYY